MALRRLLFLFLLNSKMNPIFLHLTSTESTNAFLLEKAETQNVENFVVYADNQSQGRGMGSNTWEAEPFKNLTFSLALNSSFVNVANQFQISQAVAVALHQSLSFYLDTNRLFIKWPNDILFDNSKLSGVLISNILKDNKMDLSVVGIGVNVNQIQFQDWPTHPISMKMVSGKDFDLEEILHNVVDSIYNNMESLRSGGYSSINDYYLSRLYRYRQWAGYLVDNQEKQLFMEGLDNFGRLVLRDKDSVEHVFDVKQVRFL